MQKSRRQNAPGLARNHHYVPQWLFCASGRVNPGVCGLRSVCVGNGISGNDRYGVRFHRRVFITFFLLLVMRRLTISLSAVFRAWKALWPAFGKVCVERSIGDRLPWRLIRTRKAGSSFTSGFSSLGRLSSSSVYAGRSVTACRRSSAHDTLLVWRLDRLGWSMSHRRAN